MSIYSPLLIHHVQPGEVLLVHVILHLCIQVFRWLFNVAIIGSGQWGCFWLVAWIHHAEAGLWEVEGGARCMLGGGFLLFALG
jgi:hypothetical protein